MTSRRLVVPLAGCAAALTACVFGDLFSPRVQQDLSVEILTDSLLTVGDTVRLTVRAMSGAEQVAGVRFQFSSSRPAAATVDDSGRVAVLARDSFTIRATLRSGSIPGEPPVAAAAFRGIAARIIAAPDSVKFESLGDTARVTAQSQKKQGDILPGVPVAWTSDRPTVASVDSMGLVRALANSGAIRARVIASADGRRDTVQIRVQQISRTITLSRDTVVLRKSGDTAQIVAFPRDARGNVNTGSPAVWATTSASVATVNTTGLITATGEGIAAAIATSDGLADTARVIVARGLLALSVTPDTSTLTALGDQVGLAAAGVDEANNPVPSPVMLWRSLDPGVATVGPSGVVTGAGSGTARIVGESGGHADTVVILVSQVLASVGIAAPSKDTTFTSLQDSVTFRADGRDRNGFAIPGTGPFTWSSDNTSVATVDVDGRVVALQNGTTTIRANTGGVSGARQVQVQQVIRTVDVTPNRVVVLQNTFVQLAASGFDAKGFTVAGAGFSWAIRKGSVGSVNGSGGVSASGANDSTYVVATSSNGISDSSLIRVGPISVVCVGGTGQTGRTISVSETWTAAGSPHCVSGTIGIENRAVLTIEPGVTVRFAANTGLNFGNCCDAGRSGQLRAVGTPAAPITFTALGNTGARGQWNDFELHWVDQNDSIVIRNAVVEYAGKDGRNTINNNNTCLGTVVLDGVTLREGAGDAVNLEQGGSNNCKLFINPSVIENHTGRGVAAGRGTFSITGSTIRTNGSDGVVATGGGAATVRDNLIADNAGTGLRINALAGAISGNRVRGNGSPVIIHPSSLGALLPGQKMDSLVGNTSDTLFIECCGEVSLSASDTIRTIAALPWRVNDARVRLVNGTVWKLEPGATVQSVGGNTHFLIDNGVVLAEGTESDPVRFIGSQPSRGSWGGLLLTDGPDTTRLTNVEFRYGGNGRSGMLEARDGLIILNGVRAFQSSAEGILVGTPRFFAVRGMIAADSNAGSGFNLSANGVTLADSRFVGNSGAGIYANCGVSGLTVLHSELRANGNWGAQLCATNVTFDTNTVSGNANGGFNISRGTPRVRGNTVTTNGGLGIELSGTTGSVITGNLIAGNTGTGLGVASPATISSNRIRGNLRPFSIDVPALGKMAGQPMDSLLGNTRDSLLIDRGGGDVSATDTVRTTASLPWQMNSCCSMNFINGTIWKLEAGAKVVFTGGNNMSITITDGVVLAEGTAQAPVVFTHTDPSPGGWGGFQHNDSPDTSKFRNVEFRYGGGFGWGQAFSVNGGLVIMEGVTALRSASSGISIGTPSLLVVRGPVVADSNAGIGLSLGYPGITLTNSRFVGNGSDGLQGPALTLRNSTIQGNGRDGISIGGNGSSTIENNLVADNVDVGLRFNMNNGGRIAGNRIRGNRSPVRLNSASLTALVPQNIDSMLGNTRDTLIIDCCGGNVSTTDTVRTTARLPWRVNDNLSFAAGTVWKIEPGARIVVDQRNLYVNGAVIADGGAQGILIRGRAEFPGSWGTLQFNGSTDTSVLKNVELRYGGSNYDAGLLIEGGVSHTVTLDSVRVARSVSGGIRWNGPVAVRRYLAADSNGTFGLRDNRGNVSIPAGSFSGNDDWGIELYSGGTSVANAQINNNGAAGAEGGVAFYCCGNRTITDSRIANNGSRGIYVDPNPGGNLTMRRLTIESNSSHGVDLRSGAVWFTDNTVRNNGGDGIFTSSGSAQFFNEFFGNTITGNGSYGVVLDGASLGPFAAQDQSTLLGNARDTLCICSGPSQAYFTNGSPTVTAALPWKNQVGITVGGDQTLTLDPGSRIVMDAGAALYVGRADGSYRGRLLALGSAAQPIQIVGRDSTVRGFWQQVALEHQSDSSVLRHVELVGGGGGSLQQLYLGDLAGNVIRLDTVTVRKSDNHGVWFGGGPFRVTGLRAIDNDSAGAVLTGGSVTINDSRFENNRFGIRLDAAGGVAVDSSIISGNTFGVWNNTGNPFDARNNWWGSNTGPFHATLNPGGTGNSVSDNVSFDPPLPAEPSVAAAGLRARLLARGIGRWLTPADRPKAVSGSP